MLARAIIVVLVAWSARVAADGLVIGGGSPREIGRAGVGMVGDDGGGALLVNPAAMARRDTKRAQIGVAFIDDAVDWTGEGPRATDQAGSTALPLIAAEGGLGGWVIGAGAMTTTASDRALRQPGPIPAADYANAFDYRYAGLSGSFRRDTVTIGAARRLGDAVAVGVSIAGSRVSVAETRTLWAGFIDRKDVIGDPTHDVELALSGEDSFSPSAVAGVLVAPPDTRVELGASIGWEATAHASGDVAGFGASSGVTVQTTSPTAAIDVRQPLTLRTGARWLGERWIAEIDGDLWVFSDAAAATSWRLRGVRVIDTSPPGMPSNATVDLPMLPSRISAQTHGAVRGAVDVELIAGLLWATAGYAYTTAGTAPERLSPTFGELAGQTFALGLETTAGNFTVTLGWSRTWSPTLTEPNSVWRLDNPFGTGDAQVLAGTYGGSIDLAGISLDVELDPPK